MRDSWYTGVAVEGRKLWDTASTQVQLMGGDCEGQMHTLHMQVIYTVEDQAFNKFSYLVYTVSA